MIAPLGSTPFKLSPGETVQMMVVIQNKNIGHSLVPEVRDLYEPWVEFQVADAGGHDDLSQRLSETGRLARRAGPQFHQPAGE